MANRKPTIIHELKDSYKKDPQRRRPKEPKPDVLSEDAPKFFNDVEREYWSELLHIVPPKVLTNADRWILEVTVRLMAEFRLLGPDFPATKLSHLHKCLSSLGLTPVDRSRVSVLDSKEKDSWDEF